MGCANSKQSRCKHCRSPYTPITKSYSMNTGHKIDHMISLTSHTLGSLMLEPSTNHKHVNHHFESENCGKRKLGVENCDNNKRSIDFSMGLIEAKTWSTMIDQKIPKIVPRTPISTPPGEPETINTWELMEGLEDINPITNSNHLRCFSFGVVRNQVEDSFDLPKSRFHENYMDSPKPMGLPLMDTSSNLNSPENEAKSINISDFDPDIILTFRQSLQELSPDNPFYLRPLNNKSSLDTESKKENGVTIDHHKFSPLVKHKVILYFTSLRGVRKTYEDCCHVRVIIKSLNIRVDERDVSMHSVFKDELKELLGEKFNGYGLNLPKVFLGKKFIGGIEEIRKLHEDGNLEKVLEGCEKFSDDDDIENGDCLSRVCEACGDIRFILCMKCFGSCKIFYEGESIHEDEVHEDEDQDDEYGFRRCGDCNENGLIRCPLCCD